MSPTIWPRLRSSRGVSGARPGWRRTRSSGRPERAIRLGRGHRGGDRRVRRRRAGRLVERRRGRADGVARRVVRRGHRTLLRGRDVVAVARGAARGAVWAASRVPRRTRPTTTPAMAAPARNIPGRRRANERRSSSSSAGSRPSSCWLNERARLATSRAASEASPPRCSAMPSRSSLNVRSVSTRRSRWVRDWSCTWLVVSSSSPRACSRTSPATDLASSVATPATCLAWSCLLGLRFLAVRVVGRLTGGRGRAHGARSHVVPPLCRNQGVPTTPPADAARNAQKIGHRARLGTRMRLHPSGGTDVRSGCSGDSFVRRPVAVD